MAGTCLLDSGILIDALNGKRGRRELLDRLIEDGADMACCSINVTEIYAGLRPGEEAKTERLLRSLKFYPVTWEIAKQAGDLRTHGGSTIVRFRGLIRPSRPSLWRMIWCW